jgi:hypothetical protein
MMSVTRRFGVDGLLRQGSMETVAKIRIVVVLAQAGTQSNEVINVTIKTEKR